MSFLTGRTAAAHAAAFAAALVVCSAPVAAATPAPQATFSAAFLPLAGGAVFLDGFGRGSDPGFGAPGSVLDTREFFRDLWRIDTSAIAPGPYTLDPTVIDARGTLQFTSVSFRSYDELGALQIIDFNLNATGTQAVGSGPFTVLPSCPVQVCVWIELTGTQLAGGPLTEGYGGTVLGTPIPEPETAALLALGLGAVVAAAWRRRRVGG